MLTFQHADLTRLYRYWTERCRGVARPARDDVDPIDLGWMLDRISLFECHEDPLRFRCRVAGTWFSLRLGFEANGSWLHDWPDQAMRESVLALYRLIHDDGQPRRLVRQLTVAGVTSAYEGVALPLNASRAADNVAMILVGAAPIEDPDLGGLSLIYESGAYRNWAS
jgi:hypothetical protein